MNTKWHLRFLEMAKLVATWSKDRSTQVGAVAVGPKREVRAMGYNGFPRGVDDNVEERHERPAKYAWTEHAERNCIYNATRIGVSLDGCALYCTHFPCADCARGVIQSGISSLYYPYEDTEEARGFRERTHKSHISALEMMEEAHVSCFALVPHDDIYETVYSIKQVGVEDLLP